MTPSPTDTILPADLPRALERVGGAFEVLSLDCFDTLLWRDCHAPGDVFAALGALNPGQRVAAEANARKFARTLRRRGEVSFAEIYDQAMPNASLEEVTEAIGKELEAEARTCFAFAPTVELMRAAKARGMRIAITSDTYLTAEQLARLIERSAGAEVAGLVDRVFTSCDAGISKHEGLLARVVKKMKCRPSTMLHVGDNRAADLDGARALGIPALHLVQFSETARQRLRLERASLALLGPRAGEVDGLQPHRALLAAHEPAIADPAQALGFSVLGPVFHAYDAWLREEAAALAGERGGRVHWLFMLRDGHLPHLVHRAGGEAASTARVEISRFAAVAASLTSDEAQDRHLGIEFGLNPSTLARQMLMSEEEIERVVGRPESERELAEASHSLRDELRSGKRRKITRRRARALAHRLIEHVRAACDPQPGDTLMLVDLGYNGSAQNGIDALLAQAFDCHVAGRYLLVREMHDSGLDKRGLVDASHFDPQFLEALCGNVAVLEQLATCELGSVVDYTPDGEPLRRESAVKGRQSQVREAVQEGCVRFARAALAPPVIRQRDEHAARGWREGAAHALARFMFLPQPHELEVVASFEHDVNLGSERMVTLFDTALAREGMRRRGLFYMKGSERMFLPAELAGETIETRLALMVQNMRGLGVTYADSVGEGIELEAIHFDARDASAQRIAARATHGGFHVARLPLKADGQGIALVIGGRIELVEIGSITRAPIASLRGTQSDAPPEPQEALFDRMREIAPRLLECLDREAAIVIPPRTDGARQDHGQQGMMIEIVFRPLRLAGEETPALGAAVKDGAQGRASNDAAA
ncbi:MAG: HAD hydrolase-like protein [Erythrobacter sp.]|uniref:HAD family hydrolase n=1 Tax=Erythrobacter sp. TaxID=1042 RepID=UPI0032EC24C1